MPGEKRICRLSSVVDLNVRVEFMSRDDIHDHNTWVFSQALSRQAHR